MTSDEHTEKTTTTHGFRRMPDAAFAALGEGVVAYLREISSDELRAAFPQTPRLAPGLSLWALLGADGTPILIADNREAAVANAIQHELVTVSVH
jgi:Uncharacterized small protein